MLLKKRLFLAIDLIICNETAPKINIGGRGYPFQWTVNSDQWSGTARASGDCSWDDCAQGEGNYLQRAWRKGCC
jgi:hypothetical protein